MRESLTIKFAETRTTITARSGGYKATSSQGYVDAALRLIRKIYGYAPIDLKLDQTDRGTWVASWRAPQKEAA
jgi:hypothetical protein